MRVGTVRERKDGEARVGLTPEGAHSLSLRGHEVLVETGAGAKYEDTFRATFVTVKKDGEQVLSGFATGKRLSVLSLPFTSTCE